MTSAKIDDPRMKLFVLNTMTKAMDIPMDASSSEMQVISIPEN
jgi:hypothetical protein